MERDKWAGPHPKRFKIDRWEDMVSTEVSQGFLEMEMDLQNQSICPRNGCNSLRIVGVGDSLQNLETVLGVANVRAQWRYMSCLWGSSAPGELVESSLLMASNGVNWWWWFRVAPTGAERWTHMVQSEMENVEVGRESEKEEFHELFAPLSLFRIVAAFDLMSLWYSAGYVYQRKRASTWQLEQVLRGRMVLADVQC